MNAEKKNPLHEGACNGPLQHVADHGEAVARSRVLDAKMAGIRKGAILDDLPLG